MTGAAAEVRHRRDGLGCPSAPGLGLQDRDLGVETAARCNSCARLWGSGYGGREVVRLEFEAVALELGCWSDSDWDSGRDAGQAGDGGQ